MEIKILSSLSKVFPKFIANEFEIGDISLLKNESVNFQIAVKPDEDGETRVFAMNPYLTIYKQQSVPVSSVKKIERDDYYINDCEEGLYPDVLIPLKGFLELKKDEWTAIWCEYCPRGELPAGKRDVAINILNETVSVFVNIMDASFPRQRLIHTNWFHSDCLATYYNVEVFSDEYWRIVKNFMVTAARHGVNMILTPIFTPPLDTEVGGERPTVQLIDVAINADRQYTLGFEKLKKWIEIAGEAGIEYFEISHLFTQWGALHAPKIMADTPSGYKRIFGWETDAHKEEYTDFLRSLAPELNNFLKENNLTGKVIIHTSDEPELKDFLSYKKSANVIKEIFPGLKKMDALSCFEYYKRGIVEHPIVNIQRIDEFYKKVPELWTYYCCNPKNGRYPNRFIAMPLLRVRVLGFIMYVYDVKGFLQWGYNFYYTRYSKRQVDPYNETDAGGDFPSGDSFVVYPAPDGTAYPSLRLKVFYDAVKDFEALKMLEEKAGRENTLKFLNKGLKKPISANNYPRDEKWLTLKREEINRLLED